MGVSPSVLVGRGIGAIAAAHIAGMLTVGETARLFAAAHELARSALTPAALAAFRNAVASLRPAEARIPVLAGPGGAKLRAADLVSPVEVARWLAGDTIAPAPAPASSGAAPLAGAEPSSALAGEAIAEELRSREIEVALLLSAPPAGADREDAGRSAPVKRVIPAVAAGGAGEVPFLALAELFTAGVSIDWGRVLAGHNVRKIALPTYPFQRVRYWLDADRDARNAAVPGRAAPGNVASAAADSPRAWGRIAAPPPPPPTSPAIQRR